MSTPSSFPPRRSAPAALIASLRPRQWVKNFFVLAPLVFSKHLVDPLFALRAGIAMLIFCALSGAVYAFNDVHDIDDDRRHPLKRYRPIAAGELSTRRALWLSGCLVALALGGAALMNPLLLAVAAAYVVNNLAYSLWLKKIAFVDVLLISVGFLLRVLGGAYAIHVPISVWLLACTGLLAAFLGFGKRAHELLSARRLERDAAATRPALRGYDPSTLHLVLFILALATIATYALYTRDARTVLYFGTGELIYTLPFCVVGIARFLQLALWSQRPESPTDFILRDPFFLANLASWGASVLFIIYGRR